MVCTAHNVVCLVISRMQLLDVYHPHECPRNSNISCMVCGQVLNLLRTWRKTQLRRLASATANATVDNNFSSS